MATLAPISASVIREDYRTSRCELCPRVNNKVPGYGPERCDIFFLLEAPGTMEDKQGRPLVGKTGQEFHEHYLPLANIPSDSIFKDNTVSCLPTGDGKLDPKDPKHRALIECCSRHHVYEEIKRRRPSLIVPMGGVAASLIPGLDLDVQYAIPFTWDVPGVGEHTLFPSFHPALGIHSPKEMGRLRNTFIRLRKFLDGTLVLPEDKYPTLNRSVLNTPQNLDLYMTQCIQQDTWADTAFDTEITRKRAPFCLTFSAMPGTARLVKAESRGVLDRLNWWVQKWKGSILLHNRPFDRPILAQMGVYIPHHKIIDTMAEAYHLANMPQGLKTLAYRYLGVEMQSFDDLVTPHSMQKVLTYFSQALSTEWDKPEEQLIRDTKGEWKIYKPQSFSTKIKRFFTDLKNNPEIDPFDRWDNWEMHHDEIEAKMGPYPGKCISHCPFDLVVDYACQDAARTLEIWPIIKHASSLIRKRRAYEWYG